MHRQYSNPNAMRRGILRSDRLTNFEPERRRALEERLAAGDPVPEPTKKPRRLRVSKGHVRNVQKKMRSIRKSKEKGRPPSRRIPRKTLETIIALDLK